MGLIYSKYFLPNEFSSIYEGGGTFLSGSVWFSIQAPSLYISDLW